MKSNAIFTIGYGNRDVFDFLKILKKHKIQFLIDVRSSPFSKMNPNFNKETIQSLSLKHNIKYAFLGETLGGLPHGEEHYLDSGKVNYNSLKKEEGFIKSVYRLIDAYEKGFSVVLMCSEMKPEECHRSKLIAEAILESNKDLKILHIDEKNVVKSHSEIILKATKGINPKDLFGDSTFSSINKYTELVQSEYTFFTIGVYNSTEESFFSKLEKYSIDTFIDIRQRRGVRGSKYSYVNSLNLQEKLNAIGVAYLHIKGLAPTPEIRQIQKDADEKLGITKRNRDFLGTTFIKEYNLAVLSAFDFKDFFSTLKKMRAKKIVFFCVEEKYTACHRSLVIKELHDKYNYDCINL